MLKITRLLGGLLVASACLGIQFDRSVQAATKSDDSVIKCVFVEGFFKGNGYIYKINQDRTKIRLLKAFEAAEDGSISHFEENVDLTFLSNEKGILNFADNRLQDAESTFYLEKLDFNTMKSTTFTIEKSGGVDRVVETHSSKCSYIKM